MATLPASNLHLAAITVKDRIRAFFGDSVTVTIGAPKRAEPANDQDGNVINLFFYRFTPSGFQAAAHPREAMLIRTWCLITSFAQFGEDDLKVLGEIMRFLHETPVLTPDADALGTLQAPFALEAIPAPLEAEELNHIWTTQGDLIYRPSVAYEFAVVPLDPEVPLPAEPGVEQAHWSVEAELDGDGTTATTGQLEGEQE